MAAVQLRAVACCTRSPASRRSARASCGSAARILHIEDLLDRKPRALSRGQRQRVAIRRAIVRKPKVFLFDKLPSNLDAELRVRMRYEFARLHRDLRATSRARPSRSASGRATWPSTAAAAM